MMRVICILLLVTFSAAQASNDLDAACVTALDETGYRALPVEAEDVEVAFDMAKRALNLATGKDGKTALVTQSRVLYSIDGLETLRTALAKRGLALRPQQEETPEAILGEEKLSPSHYGLAGIPTEFQPTLLGRVFIYAPNTRASHEGYNRAVATELNRFEGLLTTRNRAARGSREWDAVQEKLVRSIGQIAASNNVLHRSESGNFSFSHMLTNQLLEKIGERKIFPGVLDRLLFLVADPGELFVQVVLKGDHFHPIVACHFGTKRNGEGLCVS